MQIRTIRRTIIFICALVLAACQNQDTAKGNISAIDLNYPLSVNYSNNKLNNYKNYILQLDSADATNSTKAALKFNELFKGESVFVCDTAFVIFHSFYQSLDNTLNEIHDKHSNLNYDSLVTIYDTTPQPILSKALTDYQHTLQSNGFEVAMDEGMTFIHQDRDFIARYFYPLVSEAMKTYLIQRNKENKEGLATDGGLIISPTDLAKRILWMERFMILHPDFIFISSCIESKKGNLSILFSGLDNTPLLDDFDGVKKSLSEYYADAYQHVLSVYPNSEVAKLIGPYYNALKKGNINEAETIKKQYITKGFIYY